MAGVLVFVTYTKLFCAEKKKHNINITIKEVIMYRNILKPRYSTIERLLYGKIKQLTDRYLLEEQLHGLSDTYRLEMIQMLRHERLIHLIVLSVTALFFCGTVVLAIAIPHWVTAVLFVVIAILTLCYLHYYFFLENITQRLEFDYLKRMRLSDFCIR